MITALFVVIAVLLVTLMFVARKLGSVNLRLGLIEDESRARLDILDDQMSELGGAVIVLQRITGGPENQGIRAINHNYDGSPLTRNFPIAPERFRRSGEMYIGNPHAPIPPAAHGSSSFAPPVNLSEPIVPQPFADGEPYRDLDEEIEPVDSFPRRTRQ